ncbi:hypothetical protein HCJ57_15740 [Listeria booriae]|uniref:DUF5592 family protein n=1 Tax=Listeria booriae TaxID=1552123 RepID=UPI0016289C77|nr:DUF5592 family protein [Listeria booriae]MBC2057978.1 hypothetical protein [Listeria booriae]
MSETAFHKKNIDIPEEISTKPKLKGFIDLTDVFLFVLYCIGCFYLRSTIPNFMFLPSAIVGGLLLVYWLLPSKNNPKKKNIQTLLIILRIDRNTYHRIDEDGKAYVGEIEKNTK